MKLDSKNLSRSDNAMLDLACRVAELSQGCDSRHGAVLVKSGRVLSLGFNKRRNGSCELGREYEGATYHAEVSALSRHADTKGATLYVARINRAGSTRLSMPCPRCVLAAEDAGIKRVVFTR